MTQVNHSSQNLGKRFPLSIVLTVPFMLQTAGAVGLTGWLSLNNGRESIQQLTTELGHQTTARIQSHVLSYLAKPFQFETFLADTISSGTISPDDDPELQTFFWHQVQKTEPGTTLIYSSDRAEVIGIHKRTSDQFLLLRQDNSTDFHWNVYQLDQAGKPTTLIRSVNRPGERDRPWYKAAKDQQKPVWSPIFKAQSLPELIMTASHPLFEDSGKLKGVLGFTITLSQLTEFLNEVAITSSSQAYIMERSGDIVATSGQQASIHTDNEKFTRVSALASQDFLISHSAQHLLETYQSFEKINDKAHFRLDIQGNKNLIEVTPLNDGRGLDWLIVAIIPETNFTTQIQANTRKTIILCLIALFISLAFGAFTSRWISQIVARLIDATQRIAAGEFEQAITHTSIVELDDLARSFNEMSEQVQQSFSSLKFLNTQLSESESRLQQFLEVLPVGVAIYHCDQSLFYCNQTAQKLLNLKLMDQLASESSTSEMTSMYPLYRAETQQYYPAEELPSLRALRGECFMIEDLEVHQPDQTLTLGVRGTPILDCLGQITYGAIVFEDITSRQQAAKLLKDYNQTLEAQVIERTAALQKANQELKRLAHVDGLTQLANRRYFDAYLQQEWRRLTREQQPLSLILFDVDFFKKYNDQYGHQAGDHCLVQIARAAQAAVKCPADLVARYGGEEFVIVLPNTEIRGAITIAESIQATLQTFQIPHLQPTVSPFVTLSFGITCQRPKPYQESEPIKVKSVGAKHLLRDADIALYRAKEKGRNQYVLYDEAYIT